MTVLFLDITDIQQVAEKYFTGQWFVSVAGEWIRTWSLWNRKAHNTEVSTAV